MANIAPVNDDTFADKVLNSEMPVLVDFTASWCGPCKAMAPAIEDLAREYEGEVAVYLMDIDASPKTCETHVVRSVPTFMVFHKGQVVERILGMTSRSKLAAVLEAAIEAAQ